MNIGEFMDHIANLHFLNYCLHYFYEWTTWSLKIILYYYNLFVYSFGSHLHPIDQPKISFEQPKNVETKFQYNIA